MREIDLPDLGAMEAFGTRIATQLKPGDVVELKGQLGAGKSTLARGVLRALGHIGEVPSPTFTLMNDLIPHGSSSFDVECAHSSYMFGIELGVSKKILND